MRLDLGGRRYDLASRALVIGVLGPAPPSSAGEAAAGDWDAYWARAEQMARDGADVLEVVGPGREVSGEADALEALARAVQGLVSRAGLPVSVSTWQSQVAAEAFAAGAVLGDDRSGSANPRYLEVAAASGASVVVTHATGAAAAGPGPRSPDIVAQVSATLSELAGRALAAGIAPERVIADPGLDLGKTEEQALELLRASQHLAGLGYPLALSTPDAALLAGAAEMERGGSPEAAVAAVAAQALGISLGCRVVRTSDVRGAGRARDMLAAIMEAA
jgi:dihydropteroate synthase